MANLQHFLTKEIEGYLFEDIASLLAIDRNKVAGAAGYPILMTVLSGVELLGSLASPISFDPFAGDKYFKHYWEEYLYPTGHERGLAEHIYKCVRHGLMHAFATKGEILVSRDKKDHLKQISGALIIDADQLAADFRASYDQRFKPRSQSGASSAQMQTQLNLLVGKYAAQGGSAKSTFASLPVGAGINVSHTKSFDPT